MEDDRCLRGTIIGLASSCPTTFGFLLGKNETIEDARGLVEKMSCVRGACVYVPSLELVVTTSRLLCAGCCPDSV